MDTKDYRYIIGILIWTTIGILTFHYGDRDSEMVSYIGFAGTLVSIILAILTIIYSYYQNATTISGMQKIEQTSEEISKASNRLDSIVDTFELAQQQMERSIKCINNLNDNVSHEMHNISEQLSARTMSKDTEKNHVTMPTYTNEMIIKFLDRSSSYGLVALKICLCEQKKASHRRLSNIAKDINNVGHLTADDNADFNYYAGFIVACSCAGFIKVVLTDKGTLNVFEIDDALEDIFNQCTNRYINKKILQSDIIKRLDALDQMYQ